MQHYTIQPDELNFSSSLTESKDENWHTHDFFEIFYIKEGTIQHLTSAHTDVLQEGDAYLIPPQVAHTFQRIGQSCQHRDILIRTSFFEHCCTFVDETLYALLAQRQPIKFHLSEYEIITLEQHFYHFLTHNYDDFHKKNYEKVLVVCLLGILYNHNNENSALSDFKQKALHAMNKYYIYPNALQQIRQEFNYSDIYFARKFKEYFNSTLSQYILQLRLNRAAFLLTTSPLSIYEITHSIGFESVNYFIKTFKNKFGLTPAKYRRTSTTRPTVNTTHTSIASIK